MKVLLLAAGSQSRWQKHGGKGFKQLTVIDGETVIGRAYRLTATRCPDIITLVRDPDDPVWAGLNPQKPVEEPWMREMGKFLHGRPYWPDTGDVIILYGDAFYTEATLDLIFQGEVTQPTIYGRTRAAGRRLEAFAIRFDPARDAEEVERIARECAAAKTNGKGGAFCWFHRRHTGANRYSAPDVKKLATPKNGWIETPHDETEDFDKPRDLARWRKKFR